MADETIGKGKQDRIAIYAAHQLEMERTAVRKIKKPKGDGATRIYVSRGGYPGDTIKSQRHGRY